MAASTILGLEGCLQAWRSRLGPENVITDSDSRRKASTATFQSNNETFAILRPGSREEVQDCFRIANQFHIPIYVVSTGRNWGYGSRSPSAPSCLMELDRLNRIVEFNEDLAYVTVEPGVTQAQLFEFLQSRGSQLWMDATGASPECSVLGNTVERGFGHTPYGDHFANVCGLEVVMPDGEVVETGFARFPGAKAAPVYRWGVGPVLDGLFSQSNLGVVTRLTVWLMPKPEHFQAFYFRTDDPGKLAALINAIRPLRLNGTLRSSMHIANDYKVISAIQRYPWELTGGVTPLKEPFMGKLRKELNCGAWNGSGALYGTRAQVAEARRLVRKALAGVADKLQFLDDRKLELARRFSKPYSAITGWDISRAIELVKPVYGLMKGIPTAHSLRSCYWRKREIPDRINIDNDRCGLLWCSPIGPLDGAHAQAIYSITERVLLENGFEPIISLTVLTERTLGCVISIIYDRDVAGEDEKALAAYHKLVQTLNSSGYVPYRLGIQSMDQMNGENGYNSLLRAIKQCVDPNGILSPGRYEPKQS